VDVHVRRLREKLPGLAASILTVKSLGYRIASAGTD
jgi:DNA-binding response OmpR family regulator